MGSLEGFEGTGGLVVTDGASSGKHEEVAARWKGDEITHVQTKGMAAGHADHGQTRSVEETPFLIRIEKPGEFHHEDFSKVSAIKQTQVIVFMRHFSKRERWKGATFRKNW